MVHLNTDQACVSWRVYEYDQCLLSQTWNFTVCIMKNVVAIAIIKWLKACCYGIEWDWTCIFDQSHCMWWNNTTANETVQVVRCFIHSSSEVSYKTAFKHQKRHNWPIILAFNMVLPSPSSQGGTASVRCMMDHGHVHGLAVYNKSIANGTSISS